MIMDTNTEGNKTTKKRKNEIKKQVASAEKHIQNSNDDILIHKEKVLTLCYKWKNMEKEKPIKEINGKSECPSCKSIVKNLKIHFRKNNECGDKIDNH